MKRLGEITVVLAILFSVSRPALAQEPAMAAHGISLGVRGGYAWPLGDAEGYSILGRGGYISESDYISGMFPLWFDVGYRLNPSIYVGGFFQYGFGLDPDSCSWLRCSSIRNVRFGANIHYHFLPEAVADPWTGVGIGYEILSGTIAIPDSTYSSAQSHQKGRGFEFANLQAGLDFRLSRAARLGPWIGLTFAQYSTRTVDGRSTPVAIQALHEWFMLGIRGVYDL